MSNFLFVYGTLKTSFDNNEAKRLRREATLIGEATIKGSLYNLGPYPAFLKDSKDLVHGELFEVHHEETFQWLDRYEEVPVLYLRREVKATINDQKIKCQVYEYAGHVYAYDKIEGGNFQLPLPA